MGIDESLTGDAALVWFGELGYAVGHGPHVAPGEPATERASFHDAILVAYLRDKLKDERVINGLNFKDQIDSIVGAMQ